MLQVALLLGHHPQPVQQEDPERMAAAAAPQQRQRPLLPGVLRIERADLADDGSRPAAGPLHLRHGFLKELLGLLGCAR
jgi:hypothetical protein